jgi:hypothetical protein
MPEMPDANMRDPKMARATRKELGRMNAGWRKKPEELSDMLNIRCSLPAIYKYKINIEVR